MVTIILVVGRGDVDLSRTLPKADVGVVELLTKLLLCPNSYYELLLCLLCLLECWLAEIVKF